MNILYLWIDALCTIQGDFNDWVKQSAKMATIYGNLYVTIAATSANSCDSGIKRISVVFDNLLSIRLINNRYQ